MQSSKIGQTPARYKPLKHPWLLCVQINFHQLGIHPGSGWMRHKESQRPQEELAFLKPIVISGLAHKRWLGVSPRLEQSMLIWAGAKTQELGSYEWEREK